MTRQLLISAAALAFSATAFAGGHKNGMMKDHNKLYGTVNLAIGQLSTETSAAAESTFYNIGNHRSWVGFKGSNGSAFYGIELNLGADSNAAGGGLATTRKAYVGMKGKAWGKVAVGTMNTPYKNSNKKEDPFYNSAALNSGGTVAAFSSLGNTGAASFGYSNLNNGFNTNSLHYWSPVFAGVQVNVGTIINETNTAAGNADVSDDYNFGVVWSGFGARVGVQHLVLGNATNAVTGATTGTTGVATGSAGDKWTKIHASYGMGHWGAAINYEMHSDTQAAGATTLAEDQTHMDINAWYERGKHKVAASYGSQSLSDSSTTGTKDAFTGTGIDVGYWHKCSDNLVTNVIFSTASADDNAKAQAISVGLRYDFEAML